MLLKQVFVVNKLDIQSCCRDRRQRCPSFMSPTTTIKFSHVPEARSRELVHLRPHRFQEQHIFEFSCGYFHRNS